MTPHAQDTNNYNFKSHDRLIQVVYFIAELMQIYSEHIVSKPL